MINTAEIITLVKKYWLLGLSIIGLCFFTILLYKIYIPRINEFGCFDDCNNFMRGYFILHGKKIFSEIFSNHLPGMGYVSFLIQYITKPSNLSELILRHRQYVLLVGFIANLLLILRFRFKIVGVIAFYELTKFYIFGDRFLAGGTVVYLMIYCAGVIWEALSKRKTYFYDYVLCGIFVWFTILAREPYIPIALFLLLVLTLVGNISTKIKLFMLGIFTLLMTGTLFYHNISELIYQVYTVNVPLIHYESQTTKILGPGIINVFIYPIRIPFIATDTILGNILFWLSIFFIGLTLLLLIQKKYKLVLFAWITLGVTNLRPVTPGKEFYDAFHMIVWYGLFLFFLFSFVFSITIRKKYWFLLWIICLLPLVFVFDKRSYLFDNIDVHTSFITNYGGPLQTGNVITALSDADDTLFLDGFDDIIYIVANKQSTYKYSWYSTLMPLYKTYTDARIEMFKNNPPDFYYGSCLLGERKEWTLPDFVVDQYKRLTNSGKPSCLFIHTSKIPSITSVQWEKAKEQFYELPLL